MSQINLPLQLNEIPQQVYIEMVSGCRSVSFANYGKSYVGTETLAIRFLEVVEEGIEMDMHDSEDSFIKKHYTDLDKVRSFIVRGYEDESGNIDVFAVFAIEAHRANSPGKAIE